MQLSLSLRRNHRQVSAPFVDDDDKKWRARFSKAKHEQRLKEIALLSHAVGVFPSGAIFASVI